eukprot:CAMPEP_0185252328 /NCGR_PEP_ID=MMETSP1359-20130426/1450_1 /TAXON_ID=552665 /ORGANISM="Bigelowiella longifila, Strain CCMP242" /LENGTH=113 /DNA_ID=CAMNT_0027834469 /DNA_START=244 /DNA_END=585 /DNA_ORIENTATION=-
MNLSEKSIEKVDKNKLSRVKIGDGVKGRNVVGPKLKKSVAKIIKPDVEAQLKIFDMNADYGPCVGLTRLERWERAEKHGLNPPRNILQLIKSGHGNENAAWDDLLNGHHHALQ